MNEDDLCADCQQPKTANIHDSKNRLGHFYNPPTAVTTRGGAEVRPNARPLGALPQVVTMNWLMREIMEVNRKILSGAVDVDVAAKLQVGHKHLIRLGDLSLQASRVMVDRKFRNNEVPLLWSPEDDGNDTGKKGEE